MPRRREPDPLSLAIGQRVRQLREEADLTIEKLAYESDVRSKGHLSSLERGLVRPTVQTLAALAERLGVLVADLVIFPDDDERQKLMDRTRALPKGTVRKLLKELGAGEEKKPAAKRPAARRPAGKKTTRRKTAAAGRRTRLP